MATKPRIWQAIFMTFFVAGSCVLFFADWRVWLGSMIVVVASVAFD